jgi:hypothetical protein
MFLWHYPHDRSHWALPSRPGLSEARTFLRWSDPSVAACAYSFLFNSLVGDGTDSVSVGQAR